MSVLPEAYNYAKIKRDIADYDHVYPSGPDSIYEAIQAERRDQMALAASGAVNQRTGVILNNDSGNRLAFTMPSLLYRALRKKYPTLFKEDLKKFRKDFPVFFKAWKI